MRFTRNLGFTTKIPGFLAAFIAVLLLAEGAPAHNGWVQPSRAQLSAGEMVFLDLQLGNHSNNRLASKWDMETSKTSPSGSSEKPFLATQVAQAAPAAQASYMGAQVCRGCHQAAAENYSKTLMGRSMSAPAGSSGVRTDCEACHGPGSAHVAAGGGKARGTITFRKGVETIEAQDGACLKCHEKGQRLYWKGSPHDSRDVACVSCHKVMEKTSDRFQLAKSTTDDTCAQCHLLRKAQQMRFSHMATRDGKVDCASCHNPHGTVAEKLLRGNSINENCYSCHADKRGPMLWEHAPVREKCTTCHDPHGSVNAKLLKVRQPRLCNQCHTASRHPGTPQVANARLVFNRSCMNCHNAIHGSNHPGGMFFTR